MNKLRDGRAVVKDLGLLFYPIAAPLGNQHEPDTPEYYTRNDAVYLRY